MRLTAFGSSARILYIYLSDEFELRNALVGQTSLYRGASFIDYQNKESIDFLISEN